MLGRITDALSGLLGGSPGSEEASETLQPIEASDPWVELETEDLEDGTRLAGTAVLPEGSFAAKRLAQDGDMQFEASFDTDGTGPFDPYLVPEYFMDGYRNGGAFASDGEASAAGTSSADYEAELSESDNGPHYVLFDNTARGDTYPDGELRVEFDIEARH